MVVNFGTLSILLICSLKGTALAADGPTLYGRDDACTALEAALPGDVSYPNTTSFIQSTSYWSNQQLETRPRCFVSPKSTESVSTIMSVLTKGNWPFTVKGGGHIPFSGGSSIQDGVTIDLVHLNDVKVSSDKKTVSVGAGTRWMNVTETVETLGLAVVGGRDPNVGVGGLTLGGGISHFSGRYGWACDNVREYEVVLASGRIVTASPQENNDLYWALRGGGGLNFGIVTRFDLVTFEQGQIWINSLTFPGTSNATVIPAFQSLTARGLPSDKAATGFASVAYQPSGNYSTNVGLVYTTVPSPADSMPAVFKPFQNISSATANSSTAGLPSAFLKRSATPYGRRWTWGNIVISASFSNQFLAELMSLFRSRNDATLKSAGEAVTLTMLFQPIPVNVMEAMQKNGGNTLGLKPSNGPLIMVSFPTSWDLPQNDALVEGATRKLIADVEEKARVHKVYTGFVYMNYADAKQDVQKGYGEENYKRLVEIAQKYDPEGKLAQLWKGYFKLTL
ncbi:hypothetical protein GQ44DRAFT_721431 [Phaeosphaeriaceae sp. PMI808]|nr:hypothetical protein GQ44DRAFT_721431 [Phaeosphaeriaceae sp. PMI808]